MSSNGLSRLKMAKKQKNPNDLCNRSGSLVDGNVLLIFNNFVIQTTDLCLIFTI